MAKKDYTISDGDEIPLPSFMDEFNIRPDDFDVRKLRMTVSDDCYEGYRSAMIVTIMYDEPAT